MIHENEVYPQKDVRASLRNLTRRLKNLLAEVKEDVLVSDARGIVLHTRLQLIFNLKPADPLERRLLEIVLGHAVAAEKMGPGAFDVTLERLLENIELAMKGQQPSRGASNRRVASRPASRDDVERLVIRKVIATDRLAGSMLREALELAGFGGRVIVEKTHAVSPSVELSRGYSFDVSPAWPITARLDEPRAFVIDGYVEQVSEVHHLLEAANSAKEPVVLFVRGMSQDVLHTLRVNFDRGTLKVVPIMVRFDLEGINTVNDIAVVTGCNMVSSNKGDLISAIKFEDAPRLGSVLIYPSKTVIQHVGTAEAVAAQVKALRNKRNKADVVEDVGKLYDKRIRSLSPSHVVVRIPGDKDFVRISQAIDVALRTVRSLVDHGISEDEIPTAAWVAAEVHSDRCLETLVSLGAIVNP